MGDEIDGIGQFRAETARDRADWDRIRAFCARWGDRAFSRDPGIGGHVTGSAFVLSPERDAVLLTHHRKLDRWLHLGGHCDGLRDAATTALREAQEESGIAAIIQLRPEVFDVDIHEIPANAREPAHLHYDIRYLFRAETRAFTLSDESLALAWVPLDRLETYSTEPSLLRMRDRV